MTRVSGQQRWLAAKVSGAIYRATSPHRATLVFGVADEGRLATAEAPTTVV
jgi:hypothetical protein